MSLWQDRGGKVQTRGACVRNVLSGVLAGVLVDVLEMGRNLY